MGVMARIGKNKSTGKPIQMSKSMKHSKQVATLAKPVSVTAEKAQKKPAGKIAVKPMPVVKPVAVAMPVFRAKKRRSRKPMSVKPTARKSQSPAARPLTPEKQEKAPTIASSKVAKSSSPVAAVGAPTVKPQVSDPVPTPLPLVENSGASAAQSASSATGKSINIAPEKPKWQEVQPDSSPAAPTPTQAQSAFDTGGCGNIATQESASLKRAFDWNKPVEETMKAETIPYASGLHRAPAGDTAEKIPPTERKMTSVEPTIDAAHPVMPSDEAEDGGTLESPLLFECAWEVCWQLGGIYTVLKTKAVSMLQRWQDRYCLIGPYNPKTAAIEFEEHPAEGVIRDALVRLQEAGIPAKFGRWLVPGRPNTILIDYRARFWRLDTDKYLLWKDHGISTSNNDGEMNEVVAFGFAVAEFFKHLVTAAGSRPIVAHFHEWMGGVAVPRIAHNRIPVATVFTTHATLLGRYLASDSPEFYNHLPFLDPDKEAAKYQIYPRFAIERAAAHSATVFTTVSEVTATEAEKLLGRKADLILPNGINLQRFSAMHEFQNLHREYKEQIHAFVMGHFFPAYNFDLDRTVYIVTSGRYEYRNKGMDLFIEALARLNWRMKQLPDAPTVVAFIITRAPTRNVNVGVLQNRSMFDDFKSSCDDLASVMGDRLFESAAHGRMPTLKDLIDEDSLVRLKKSIHAWRNGQQPAIVTHDMVDGASDPVLQHLRHRHLFNSADDRVKVVFHPEFVTATSPLIGLDYDHFVRGCHLGIFPSYYEPWGYTPMECIALGVPTVTTDLSGFGAYVERHIDQYEEQGVMVLKRRTKSFEDSTNDLVEYLFRFVQFSRRQRIEQRNRVERLSELFDWSALVGHYHHAHDVAIERQTASVPAGRLEVRMV